MHREYPDIWHVVVHRKEDRLFHFTGILGADDDDLFLLQGLNDADGSGQSERCGIFKLEVTGVENDPVGIPVRFEGEIRLDKKGLGE